MPTTRTHTVYFGDEALLPLIEANVRLWDDLAKRKPYMSEKAFLAAAERLGLVNTAIGLLKERVCEE